MNSRTNKHGVATIVVSFEIRSVDQLNRAIAKIKNIELPKENIIDFLDKNPNSEFAKLCEEYCDVKYLKNRIRDPRAFVDKKKSKKLKSEIEKFNLAIKKSTDPKKYAKNALKVKSANILANIGISSFLLAVALPEITFYLRKKITGSDAEPGLNT